MNYPGTEMHVVVSFKLTDTGAAADPTTVIFKLKDPSATVTSYVYGAAPEVTKTSVGNYVAKVPISAVSASAGRWSWRWEATGAVVGATEGNFLVRETEFA